MEELGQVMGLGVVKGLVRQVRGKRRARGAGKPGAHIPESEGCLAVATISQPR